MVSRKGQIAAMATMAVLLCTLLSVVMTAGTVQAASYSFSVDQERVTVTVLPDGSVDVDYVFVFSNVGYLDGVDIGLPNSLYDGSSATARIVVGGTEYQPAQIHASPYVSVGQAVEFDQVTVNAITAMRSFTLYYHVNNPHMVYLNEQNSTTAGIRFRPTWFDPNYQIGPTGLVNATIVFPAGMTNTSEALYLENQPYDDLWVDSSTGRVMATWQFANVSPQSLENGQGDVGVAFPLNYVDTYFDPSTDPNLQKGDTFLDALVLLGLLAPIIVVAIFLTLVVVAVRSANTRRRDYFEPTVGMVGAGPRRDLTAVEAAIMLERPLETVATMILFGLIKKNKVEVMSEAMPMRLKKLSDDGDYPYETAYLRAIGSDGTLSRSLLRNAMVDLIRSTSAKLEGFDLDKTRMYYRTIVEKAWQQVTAAKTPEEFAIVLRQQNDWMMIDRDYENRMRRQVFPLPILLFPHNPNAYGWPQSAGQGKNLAQDYVDRVKSASNNLVRDMRGLAREVAPVTNPLSALQTGTGIPRGGGAHCACACACACAGGGR
jgi:hypothetical protein